MHIFKYLILLHMIYKLCSRINTNKRKKGGHIWVSCLPRGKYFLGLSCLSFFFAVLFCYPCTKIKSAAKCHQTSFLRVFVFCLLPNLYLLLLCCTDILVKLSFFLALKAYVICNTSELKFGSQILEN